MRGAKSARKTPRHVVPRLFESARQARSGKTGMSAQQEVMYVMQNQAGRLVLEGEEGARRVVQPFSACPCRF